MGLLAYLSGRMGRDASRCWGLRVQRAIARRWVRMARSTWISEDGGRSGLLLEHEGVEKRRRRQEDEKVQKRDADAHSAVGASSWTENC